MLQTATLAKPQLSASTIDIVYQWCYSARLHLFSINPCLIKSIYIANESTNLSINGFPLKCIFEQARRKMIKKIHLNSIVSDQGNKYLRLLKLPCSRMGKHISQIKFSPLPNCKDIWG